MSEKKNADIKVSDPLYSGVQKKKVWIGSYLLILFLFIAGYALLRLKELKVLGLYQVTVEKLLIAGILTIFVLVISKFAELVISRKSHTTFVRYNLNRIVRLLKFILIFLIFISVLFANWYTAAVSLGLISLIVGFALQTPISSFIGWLYIIIRAPYHVGDRIQVADFTGDVVEVNYLDTTLWEFAGDYLTNDLPSGRMIRFPNSLLFQAPVYNYSLQKFPFIWNEIPFHIGYQSDLDFVEITIKNVSKIVLGTAMLQNIIIFKELAKQTPIDDLQIKEYPFVCFRINPNTWVEASVTYLVAPKMAATVRSSLIKAIIAELKKSPEKVLFPKGDSR